MNRSTFLELLERSNLLSESRLVRVVEQCAHLSPRAISKILIQKRWLNRFQARQLLAGHAIGLKLGPYRLLKQIGVGSVGIVYKAYHEVMRRSVGLKVVRHQTDLPGSCGRQLFQREVRAASRLNHPNIVAVYDAAHAKGVDYLAMEYVRGPDLFKLVAREGPLDLGLVCELMRQAAEALEYSRSQGLVHCDIKPSNLLLQWTQRWKLVRSNPGTTLTTVRTPMLKILDFGLAQLKGAHLLAPGTDLMEAAGPGSIWGTLDFMSPEQFADLHDVDVRSDLYSLGCTFYYALTGQVPYPGTTEAEKLVQHATEAPVPIQQLRPEVPAPIAQIFTRLLAKDRNERFANPTELAQELIPWTLEEKTPLPPRSGADSATLRTVSDLDLNAESQTQTGAIESGEHLPPAQNPGQA